MKLTHNEKLAYEALMASHKPMTVDEIAERVYGPVKPTFWRKSLLGTMRMLIAKSQTCPEPVTKTSGSGRSVKAVFVIE